MRVTQSDSLQRTYCIRNEKSASHVYKNNNNKICTKYTWNDRIEKKKLGTSIKDKEEIFNHCKIESLLVLLFLHIEWFVQSLVESLLLPDDEGPFTGEFSLALIPLALSSGFIDSCVPSKWAYCLAEFFALTLSCFLQRTISCKTKI